MRVAVIMGSPRKKDSFKVCEEIEQQLRERQIELEMDYIFLSEYNILDCKGCGICFQKSETSCPCRNDDLTAIKERILAADGVIMASPVYAYQVTGQMKRFIDRTSYLFHRQEFCGKPALIVVTTDGGGSKQVVNYLKMTLSGWGMDIIGNLQIVSSMYFENRTPKSAFGYDQYYYEKQKKKVVSLAKAMSNRLGATNKRKPTFYDIFMFNCLRSKTYTSIADRNYWREKGWMEANYFYEVQLNPMKKLFGCMMKGLIARMGKRYLKG